MKRKLEKYFLPQLAEEGTVKDLDREGYIAELKVDDSRCIIERDENGFRIYGRRGLVYNETLPDITKMFSKIRAFYRLDGGLCFIDSEGHMVFRGSQKRCQVSNPKKVEEYMKKYPLMVYLWDITYLNGEDFTNKDEFPYWKRRLILKSFIDLQKALYGLPNLRLVPTSAEIHKLFKWAVDNGYEGVILKKLLSKYESGKRNENWLKVKAREHTIFVLKEMKDD